MAYGRCARLRSSKPKRRHQFEIQLRQSGFLLVDGAQPTPADPVRCADPIPARMPVTLGGVGSPVPYQEVAAAAD